MDRVRLHILHLSSADALPMIRSARRDGLRLSVEVCPHYLTFTAEEIPDGATEFKCCPPIREAANRDELWAALADGTIDCIVSDHSPCTPELKRFDLGDFDVAWGGISSLQLGLPAVWTEARQRGHALADVVRWMAERPAAQAGLRREGAIALGNDADFAVFAPDKHMLVDPAQLRRWAPHHARDALANPARIPWPRRSRPADGRHLQQRCWGTSHAMGVLQSHQSNRRTPTARPGCAARARPRRDGR